MNILFKYLTAFAIVLVFLSNSTDPPNGRTGAPGDGVCSSCHQGNNFEGDIQIDGLPSEVVSGDTYSLQISVNNTDGRAVRAGFQMVSLFNDSFTNAGELKANSNDEGISVAGDRRYIEHRGAKNFQDNVAQWIFDWEAPIVDEEKEVVMFAVGNIANGSGSSGDAIRFREGVTLVKPIGSDDLEVAIINTDIICNGETADLVALVEGGEKPYSYNWSNGVMDSLNENLVAGFYDVTITDANDSTATAEIVLGQPDPFTLMYVVSSETAIGAEDGTIETTVTGGVPPYVYLWSNDATTEDIGNLASGDYILTLTDANGCSTTDTVTVEGAACEYEVNLSVNQVTCAGANDGEAFIDPSGFVQPLSFEWSNGDNSFIAIAGLEPGDYAVSLTDGSGCTIVETFTIMDAEPLVVDAGIDVADCNNPVENIAFVTASGGTGDLSCAWSNGSTADTLFNLPEGDYSVTVTDENGCSETIDGLIVSFEDIEAPELSFETNIDLYVDANGNIDTSALQLAATDNCGIESVILSGDLSCASLESRTLTYEVTDLNGNLSIGNIEVLSIIDTIPPTVECVDDIVQDGCDTIFYEIPSFFDNCNVARVELAEGFESGSVFPKDSTKVTYNAYDDAGNFACCSFWVVVSNNLELAIDEVVDATSESNGAINITVSGGTGEYTYEWIQNDSMVVSNFEDVSNLQPGAYTVKVTDADGCILISDAILVEMGSSLTTIEKQEIGLLPNPVANQFQLTNIVGLKSYAIVTLNGQVVENFSTVGNGERIMVDVSSYEAGVYFVKLRFVNGIHIKKFVKL